jgi:hypothetical protein
VKVKRKHLKKSNHMLAAPRSPLSGFSINLTRGAYVSNHTPAQIHDQQGPCSLRAQDSWPDHHHLRINHLQDQRHWLWAAPAISPILRYQHMTFEVHIKTGQSFCGSRELPGLRSPALLAVV